MSEKRRLTIVVDVYISDVWNPRDQTAMEKATEMLTADGKYSIDGDLIDAQWEVVT